jgi:tetratricopeptide (TPR) repeat protein
MAQRLSFGVVLLFCALLPDPLLAQGAPKPVFAMRVEVFVRLADNKPAPVGTLVELDYANGEMVDQGQTDSSARCIFAPGGHGLYLIRAKAPGYKEVSQQLDLQNAQTGMVNLVLVPLPGHDSSNSPAGGSVSVSGLAVPDGARKEFEKGQKSLSDKDLDGGITHLKKAIEIYPSYPEALTLLGTAYNEKKDWKDAQGTLEKATAIDPKNASAFFQLGAALNQTKDYPGAEKALSQGLTLAPDAQEASGAQYELARAYMAQNSWKEAEPYAAKVVASQPDFAAGRLLMGNIFLKKGDGNGAIHEFQEYLRIDPKGPAADQIKDMIPKIQAAMKKQS